MLYCCRILLLLCCSTSVLYSATIINVRAVLQGPCDRESDSMITALQQTMSLPATDPYGTGIHTEVFPENTVDWVLLELRTAPTTLATFRQAALLRSDGIITDVNGALPAFDGAVLPSGAYYIVVRHRNHLAVMSAAPVALSATTPLYDFTTGNEKVYVQFGTEYGGLIQLSQSVWAIPAGDVDSSGVITPVDAVRTKSSSGYLGYGIADVSLDGVVNAVDRVIVRDNMYRYSSVPGIIPKEHNNSPLQLLSLAPLPVSAGEKCTAEFSLDRAATVRIELIDINGRSVIVQEKWLLTGCHSFDVPREILATGTYYLVFTTENYTESRRLLVVR